MSEEETCCEEPKIEVNRDGYFVCTKCGMVGLDRVMKPSYGLRGSPMYKDIRTSTYMNGKLTLNKYLGDHPMSDSIMKLYVYLKRKKYVTSFGVHALVASCTFFVLNQHNQMVSIREIADMFQLDIKQLFREARKIYNKYGLAWPKQPTVLGLIVRICESLDIINRIPVEYFNRLTNPFNGIKRAWAAAIIYLSYSRDERTPTSSQRLIAAASNITEVTLRTYVKRLKKLS